jgi:hypothetical protein
MGDCGSRIPTGGPGLEPKARLVCVPTCVPRPSPEMIPAVWASGLPSGAGTPHFEPFALTGEYLLM